MSSSYAPLPSPFPTSPINDQSQMFDDLALFIPLTPSRASPPPSPNPPSPLSSNTLPTPPWLFQPPAINPPMQVKLDGEPADGVDPPIPPFALIPPSPDRIMSSTPPPLLNLTTTPSPSSQSALTAPLTASIPTTTPTAKPPAKPIAPVAAGRVTKKTQRPSPQSRLLSPLSQATTPPQPALSSPKTSPRTSPKSKPRSKTSSSSSSSSSSSPAKASASRPSASASSTSSSPVSKSQKALSQPTPLSLKEKREREAKLFPKEVLANLDGTTSAEVRKMNPTERELVLYKRKLRNRESARRSRQKRQATLHELQEELDELHTMSSRIVDMSVALSSENDTLKRHLANALLHIKTMRNRSPDPSTDPALKMKLAG